ncbi:CRP/FNR family transcriptional regulator [Planococcus donghaensis MPA1U2]|uniref:CRP/FNR family transcriptional regulator n=1 Tax=Planococcus donghaensis MPA1U2 TaxID=933115 RepID=E7RHX3_9BACL|nr:Crp/Fnr family transcriptional regulator [Planococcus donghaensis]EGA89403.1 CRP/FNR family transcriptional regulator [Planococcus donghaensis MPA1U2]
MDDNMRELELLNPWFDKLPYDWNSLSNYGTEVSCKKNTILFNQNEPGEFIYMVRSGRVRLYLISSSGEEKALSIIGENGILGECCLGQDSIHSTNAVCASEVRLQKISRNDFLHFIAQKPEYILQTLDLITKKYRLLCMQSLHLSYMKSLPRICGLLIQLALKYSVKQEGNKHQLTILFTQQEMANLLGTTRVTVAKNMKWLEDNNYIFKDNKYYIINDIKELNELSKDQFD